jgi:hypothetical protein
MWRVRDIRLICNFHIILPLLFLCVCAFLQQQQLNRNENKFPVKSFHQSTKWKNELKIKWNFGSKNLYSSLLNSSRQLPRNNKHFFLSLIRDSEFKVFDCSLFSCRMKSYLFRAYSHKMFMLNTQQGRSNNNNTKASVFDWDSPQVSDVWKNRWQKDIISPSSQIGLFHEYNLASLCVCVPRK